MINQACVYVFVFCRQKLLLPSKKPYIYFKCQSRKTIITWGDTAAKAGGTGNSASTAVESLGFIASDCTFAVSRCLH